LTESTRIMERAESLSSSRRSNASALVCAMVKFTAQSQSVEICLYDLRTPNLSKLSRVRRLKPARPHPHTQRCLCQGHNYLKISTWLYLI
jgi:hypothetical protein